MRLLLQCFCLLAFATASPALGAPAKALAFDGSLNQVFDATVKAVEKNWKKVRSSNRSAGEIRFHTGVSLKTWGEDCTALLRDLGNGKVEVSLKVRNSAQLYAWGVGDQIALKLFKAIQDELSTSSQAPTESSPPPSVQK